MQEHTQHSKWKVRSKNVAGLKFWQVYRIIDCTKPNTSDNHEIRGGLHERLSDAVKLAVTLNAEKEKPSREALYNEPDCMWF